MHNFGAAFISGNVFINGDFTNDSTAVYQNNGVLFLTGNFINNQSNLMEGTGVTSFIGTRLQLITGSESLFFHHVS